MVSVAAAAAVAVAVAAVVVVEDPTTSQQSLGTLLKNFATQKASHNVHMSIAF